MKGVIFDMDGVLCDSEPYIYEAARRMFVERYDVDPTREDFAPFVGAGEDRFIGGVGEAYDVEMDIPRDKARTYEIYLEIIKGRLEPLAGAVEFVRRCRERGLKLAVATSADRVKMEGNLTQIGVPPDHFDAVVTGSDIERKKPDPQAFETAAAKLELPPSQCLVIEDAPNGVEAARAAGSWCLGLTTSFDDPTLRGYGAHWTAGDLAHVPADVLDGDAAG
jgi:HAD superfamily hydrolase (TIGR01509 family)